MYGVHMILYASKLVDYEKLQCVDENEKATGFICTIGFLIIGYHIYFVDVHLFCQWHAILHESQRDEGLRVSKFV